MLLKVSDGDGGWVLIDNVEQPHLLSVRHTVRNPTELDKLGKEGTLNLISKECFAGPDVSVNVGIVEFVRKGESRKLLFTDIVYICTDNGDTIDKMSVFRKTERRR